MYNDPELRPFMESPNASWWVGPGGHIMAYPIRKGKIYNFNLTHMGPVPSGMMVEAGIIHQWKQPKKGRTSR
jgi:salicylate hydroxylase